MDASEASKKVAEYFRGVGNPIAFLVTRAVFDAPRSEWRVECEFFPWLGASERARFHAWVDEGGRITEVVQVESTAS